MEQESPNLGVIGEVPADVDFGADGLAFPRGAIVDDKGNIFATTETGGTYNSGVAFEITP
jgi:hypothetical protein